MTREQLKQYRTLKLELEDVNASISRKMVQDSVQGSMEDYPYILQNNSVKGVTGEDYSLLIRKSELKAQIAEIESFVEGIEDPLVRNVFKMKYFKNHTNQYIATKIGKRDEGTVRKIILRYLKNSENSDFGVL